MADIAVDLPGKKALVGVLYSPQPLIGVISPLNGGDTEAAYNDGYKQGKTDGEQNALDAVNYELAGRGLEKLDSVEEIPHKLDDAFITLEANGYQNGIEQGKQAEYDRFWDAFQQSGNRADYSYAFYGEGWKDVLTPKYDLKTQKAEYTFAYCTVQDLEATLANSGVRLDTSNCTSAFRMFNRYCSPDGTSNPNTAAIIPALDLSKATNIGELFSYANVKVIRKIILNDQGTQDTSTLFHGGCAELEEIRVEGVIGKNFRPQWSSKLSNESVQSIIDHLKDLTGATAQTLTFHADVGAKLTQAQKDAISAKNWTLAY